MSAWWSIAADHIAQGRALVLVTVCTVEGSAPREAGAKMLVWDDGQHGTVGGGKLEFTIVEQACRMLGADAPWRVQHYPLGPLLGQCCGGHVSILLERLDRQSQTWLESVARAEADAAPYAIVSQLEPCGIAKQVYGRYEQGDDTVSVFKGGEGQIASRIGEGFTVIERIDPRPPLLLFGAGHVGQALAPVAATLPFHLGWFDTRPEFAATGATIAEDLLRKVADAPFGGFFLIFTHSHDLDYRLAHAVLARNDFRYCGLIGSATKRARFEKRLLADGIPRERLAQLICPIGEIGLSSKVPQVMAVAIAAELLLVLERTAQLRLQEFGAPKVAHGG